MVLPSDRSFSGTGVYCRNPKKSTVKCHNLHAKKAFGMSTQGCRLREFIGQASKHTPGAGVINAILAEEMTKAN